MTKNVEFMPLSQRGTRGAIAGIASYLKRDQVRSAINNTELTVAWNAYPADKKGLLNRCHLNEFPFDIEMCRAELLKATEVLTAPVVAQHLSFFHSYFVERETNFWRVVNEEAGNA